MGIFLNIPAECVAECRKGRKLYLQSRVRTLSIMETHYLPFHSQINGLHEMI